MVQGTIHWLIGEYRWVTYEVFNEFLRCIPIVLMVFVQKFGFHIPVHRLIAQGLIGIISTCWVLLWLGARGRFHNYKGGIGSTVHRAAINWFLKFITALSAAFIRCMCGGTSWNCISESSTYFLRSSDTSLSMMWNFGVNPRFLNLSWILVIP